MERDQTQLQYETTGPAQPDAGFNIVSIDRHTWRSSTEEAALNYFKRDYIKFSALKWGLRGLIVGGVIHAGYVFDEAIKTHNAFLAVGAAITGGLVVFVREFNARNVGRRASFNRRVISDIKQRIDRRESGES